jgi:hypothetical protein
MPKETSAAATLATILGTTVPLIDVAYEEV